MFLEYRVPITATGLARGRAQVSDHDLVFSFNESRAFSPRSSKSAAVQLSADGQLWLSSSSFGFRHVRRAS
jgi:hypothetical protein